MADAITATNQHDSSIRILLFLFIWPPQWYSKNFFRKKKYSWIHNGIGRFLHPHLNYRYVCTFCDRRLTDSKLMYFVAHANRIYATGRWMRALQICCKYKRIEASDVLHKARDRSLVQFEINWAPQLVSCAEHKTHTTRKSTSKKIEWEYTVCHTHTHTRVKSVQEKPRHTAKKKTGHLAGQR